MKITHVEVSLEEQGEGFTTYLRTDASGLLQVSHISAFSVDGRPKSDPEKLIDFVMDQFGEKIGVASMKPWDSKPLENQIQGEPTIVVWYSKPLEKKV